MDLVGSGGQFVVVVVLELITVGCFSWVVSCGSGLVVCWVVS